MSCVISVSDSEKEPWGIRNTIFSWFVSLVLQRLKDDTAAAAYLKYSELYQHVPLNVLRVEDPALAARIAEAFLRTSEEIAAGKHPLLDYEGRPWPELQEPVEQSFADLADRLRRCSKEQASLNRQ